MFAAIMMVSRCDTLLDSMIFAREISLILCSYAEMIALHLELD